MAVRHSFFPGIVFILTFWYRREELGLRIALFYCSSALAGAFGGLLAYAILSIDSLWGFVGWQLVFLFEGAGRGQDEPPSQGVGE
jgi:sugar phosphate permease